MPFLLTSATKVNLTSANLKIVWTCLTPSNTFFRLRYIYYRSYFNRSWIDDCNPSSKKKWMLYLDILVNIDRIIWRMNNAKDCILNNYYISFCRNFRLTWNCFLKNSYLWKCFFFFSNLEVGHRLFLINFVSDFVRFSLINLKGSIFLTLTWRLVSNCLVECRTGFILMKDFLF